MYATGGDKCPVKSLRELISRTEDDATALLNHCSKDALKSPDSESVWFISRPVKPYQFSCFMSDISKNAGCSMSYTAHFLRATSIQAMSDAGHELRHIMLMTGHRNEASIRSYSRTCSDEQKRDLSNTLNNVLSAKPAPSAAASASPCSPNQSESALSALVPTTAQHSVVNRQHALYQPTQLNSSNFLSSGFLANSTFNNCSFQFHVNNN